MVTGKCETIWPPESLAAEQRFGQWHARLFPFLKKGVMVWTPAGAGQLVQSFADWCVLEVEGKREIRVRTEDVRPIQ